MRILLLADINSSHILQWVSAFKGKDVELAIFSLSPLQPPNAHYYHNVKVECMDFDSSSNSPFQKAKYFLAIPKMRKLYKIFSPDIVHAHYASSYGLLGALAGFKKLLISVWGSDVYVYPKQGRIFEKLLRFALNKADHLFSTSQDMARETLIYTTKVISVIPFGIDTNEFKPSAEVRTNTSLHFATAKSLSPIYNIPTIVSAFKAVLQREKEQDIYLHIAGDGPLISKCVEIAGELKDQNIFFYGAVPHAKMPEFFNNKDVLINIPDSESFGVSVLEASASGLAIIATNKGGLKEVVKKNKTGIFIESPKQDDLIVAMELFIQNRNLAEEMGRAGRAFVLETYPWNKCVELQIDAYNRILSSTD